MADPYNTAPLPGPYPSSGIDANSRQPTLLPNIDPAVVSSQGTTDFYSPNHYAQSFPRVSASATVTLGGTVTTGDKVYIEIVNNILPGSINANQANYVQISVTAAGGDTLTSLGDKLVVAILGSATLLSFGITATNAAGAVTISWPGPIGNFSVVQAWSDGTGSTTITVGGTATNNDTLNVQFAGNLITGESCVIGGSKTTADVLNLFITDPAIPGDTVELTYTVLSGDTLTTITTAFATAINGNASLTAAGISAYTNGSTTLLIAYPTSLGTPSFSATTSVGATETFTFSATVSPKAQSTSTVTTSESTTNMALGLAAAINANATAVALGISASPSSAVITLTIPAGAEEIAVTKSITGSATETLTIAGAATETVTPNQQTMSGGSGPIIPYDNFTFAFGGTTNNFAIGKPQNVGYQMLQAMVQQRQHIS